MTPTYGPSADDDITLFIDACNKICEGKYLLCERRISELLKTIASSDALYSMFGSVLNGYDHKTEFAASRRKIGGRSKLIPPQSRPRFMAYVFCVLLGIDDGKPHMRDFLDEYFYHTNPNEEYALFCSALIVPFRDVTEYVFYNGIDKDEDEQSDGGLNESVRAVLGEMNRSVSESTAPYALKQDLYLIAKAIDGALTPNRIDLIKPLIVGYRHAANGTSVEEGVSPLVDKLTRLLTVSGII